MSCGLRLDRCVPADGWPLIYQPHGVKITAVDHPGGMRCFHVAALPRHPKHGVVETCGGDGP